jgi:hypothetical protein
LAVALLEMSKRKSDNEDDSIDESIALKSFSEAPDQLEGNEDDIIYENEDAEIVADNDDNDTLDSNVNEEDYYDGNLENTNVDNFDNLNEFEDQDQDQEFTHESILQSINEISNNIIHDSISNKKSKSQIRNPLSAWILFSSAMRERINRETPGQSFSEVAKIIALSYKTLRESQKQEDIDELNRLNAAAEADKLRYRLEIEQSVDTSGNADVIGIGETVFPQVGKMKLFLFTSFFSFYLIYFYYYYFLGSSEKDNENGRRSEKHQQGECSSRFKGNRVVYLLFINPSVSNCFFARRSNNSIFGYCFNCS